MITRRFAVLALVLIPALASAQRGGGGRGGSGGFGKKDEADWNSLGRGNAGLQLSNRDVENISPIKLLIDKKKDLKLSDDQVKRLKDLESTLKDKNDGPFKALDSLRRETRNTGGSADEARARMMSTRQGVMSTVATIRGNYEGSLKDAMPVLDDTQQKTATELVAKQAEEAEEMLREKMRGGRGGGGDEGRAGGRPPRV
jgi:hypothetical protein